MQNHEQWVPLYDVRSRVPGEYERYMLDEGIPVHEALVGISDVTQLPRQFWSRTGGQGAFVQMLGSYQAERGMYVVEIPPGGELKAERHLYEELLWVLRGQGATEVWQDGTKPQIFEWREGSVFAPPLNTWHRLYNGTTEPALLFAVTTAPRIMNTLHDSELVFNCDHQFKQEFTGRPNYFSETKGYNEGRSEILEANFIPDAKSFVLKSSSVKTWGSRAIRWRMNKYWPNGHISEWPVGVYHQAHRHGPGAIILGLTSNGYVLAWPHDLGNKPFQNCLGDQVVRIPWGANSVYTPPDNWYHQHFNTGRQPARHIAVHSGVNRAVPRKFGNIEDFAVMVSENDGGLLISYADEDPEIRRRFEQELTPEGIQCNLPPVQTDRIEPRAGETERRERVP
jgi:quercetin dioxygenase-like cupin family protein